MIMIMMKIIKICILSYIHPSIPHIDVYTGGILTKKAYSVEHIIPRRMFVDKSHANDPINLVPCDIKVNRLRSDYKYGTDPNLLFYPSENIPILNAKKEFAGSMNRKRRIFYPSVSADKGLISRSIIGMLYKYPYLYRNLNDIVDSPNILFEWSLYPPSTFEIERKDIIENEISVTEKIKKKKN